MTPKPTEQTIKEKKISQIINPKCLEASPNLPVSDAIDLMQQKKAGYIVITKNKKVIGIFTETDVVRRIMEKEVNWKTPVSEFMTKDPTVLSPQDSVGKAIDVMGKGRFYHLPLVDKKNHLAGILSVRTLIRYLAEFYPTEVYNLPPDPSQVMETPEGG